MRIAIIGGGIGGLTAALALRQLGFEPQVFEQAPDLLDVGAAILMWPNAMRVLHRLGLAAAIREHGAVLEKARWLRRDGKLLNQFPLPKSEVPAVALHRADLQHTLVQALPRDTMHLGHVFENYEQLPDQIIARFSDSRSFACDALIAADGIHSHARMQLLNDGPPTEHGYLAWRGVAPHTPPAAISAAATEIYGRGQRFGFGPLGFGKVGWWASTNKSLLRDHSMNVGNNLAASLDSAASNKKSIKSESGLSIRAELLRLFGGWHEPVPDLIRATPLTAFVKNRVFDRSSSAIWGTDRVTLLGDAIHPLTPNLGQGGGLAIEDAAVLARCFEKYAGNETATVMTTAVARAMRRYESLRVSRTAWVTRYSRVYGIIGQWESRRVALLRDLLLSLVPSRLTARFLRGVFDYDAYAVRI
jgi:2-polyprenyl-6-methoxyphenol hydroxylase-like FAD-dependent oxidoreductase